MLLLLDCLAAYGPTHIKLLPSTKPVAGSVKDSGFDCKHVPRWFAYKSGGYRLELGRVGALQHVQA